MFNELKNIPVIVCKGIIFNNLINQDIVKKFSN